MTTPVLDVRGFDGTGRSFSFSGTPEDFQRELVRMATRLGLDPSPIAAVMSIESAFKPNARNPHTRATGLIQFMPATAIGLGTTIDELAQISALQQLPFVEKYFRPLVPRIKTPGDYYMAVFMPAHVGEPGETELFRKGTKGYEQNAVLDRDGDGVIRIADVTRTIEARLADARARPPVLVDVDLSRVPRGDAPKAEAPAGSGSLSPVSSEPSSSPLPTENRGVALSADELERWNAETPPLGRTPKPPQEEPSS